MRVHNEHPQLQHAASKHTVCQACSPSELLDRRALKVCDLSRVRQVPEASLVIWNHVPLLSFSRGVARHRLRLLGLLVLPAQANKIGTR
jgi:hypothetical protein